MNAVEYQTGITHGERGAIDPARYVDGSDYAIGCREGKACRWLRQRGDGPPVGIGAATAAAKKLGWTVYKAVDEAKAGR